MITVPFTKMVGTGNDFIVMDARRGLLARRHLSWREASRVLCDRHVGIGADGVLVLERSTKADARMRVFNPDGSEAEMCGNGARCVALYLASSGQRAASSSARHMTIETKAGVMSAAVRRNRVAMRMTNPRGIKLNMRVTANGRRWRLGFVNTGVPHVVIPVPAVDRIDVEQVGRALRYHRAFAPRGSNVDFIQPTRRNALRVRTYERGVEGETLACGTGVAASAVIHALNTRRNGGAQRRIQVETKSGDILTVSFAINGSRKPRVIDLILEGPAARVFEGMVQWTQHRSRG